jgi:hypothetical protein
MIAIEPRGADLDAVTAATRNEGEIAAIGGYIAQVWTWRGGEAVVVREWSPRFCERWAVIVRRGLRRGIPQRVVAESIVRALAALGIPYRIKSAQRRPRQPEAGSKTALRRRLLPAIRRRGNTWRILRARASS